MKHGEYLEQRRDDLIELWSEDSIQAELECSKRNAICFNKIARNMEATGFGNPLLYFNTRENYYTRVINSYVDNVLWKRPHFSIPRVDRNYMRVYVEWNSSTERLWNGTERNGIIVPGLNRVFNLDDAVDRFARKHPRKLQFL